MHHYCKKAIAGKKANLKTLRPASRQRYTVARPQVTLMDNVTPVWEGGGVNTGIQTQRGLACFLKGLLHKHSLLSERLGMEPLQCAVS